MGTDEEIVETVRCNGCGCAITPELHEAKSGEYELSFFVCPFCGKRYVISITDDVLRKSIEEYCGLRQAAEKDELSEEELERMKELKAANRERMRALKEAFGYADR